ncbi:MAG: YbaK/EbsC family protein, partial [Planctomycetota bacterium]
PLTERLVMSEIPLAISTLLQQAGINFRELQHEPTLTSAESARVRGEPLFVGAKALLLKVDAEFALFVLPAHLKLDSSAIKRQLQAKKLRFATPDELRAQTGLVPGSVPPFGRPILPYDLYADESIGTVLDRVAFNAGALTHSIIMSATDWRRIAQPREFRFGLADESDSSNPGS